MSKGFAANRDSRVNERSGSNSTPEAVEVVEAPIVEICEELSQPVAVDGCGGSLPPPVLEHDNEHDHREGVTPTAVWTEMPVIPSDLSPSQIRGTTPHTIGGGEATIISSHVCDEKGKCKDVTKGSNAVTSTSSLPHSRQSSACLESTQERFAGSKPWVSALSTSDILAPIPEAEVSVSNSDNVEISNGAAKPKALPLKVSHAARKGLAKIATPRIQPTRTQDLLDGYVHGLTVEANVKPSNPLGQKTMPLKGVPSNKGSCPEQSLAAGISSFGNQGESGEHRPGQKSLRCSKSAGQSPLTPGRRVGTTGNSKSCPRLVRDYCGNCFHPALISSALGNNETLKRWVAEGEGGPNVLVADQSEAFHVFARLCDQVDAEAKHKVKNEKVVIDRTLPPFQTLEPCGAQQTASHVVSEKPDVLPPSIAGCRKVRVTKAEKHIQQCIDAALHKLEEHQCLALRTCGLERIFDGLRATCFVPFQFQDYSTCVIGEDPARLRHFAIRFPLQCPSLQQVEALRTAFQVWNAHPTLCTLMSVLITRSGLKKDSSWPIGHVLLLPGRATSSVCYLGDAAPKLLLLVNAARPQAPEVYVVEATAYRNALQLKHLPVACQLSWPDVQLRPDQEFSVELRDGQGILNVGAFHCQQEGCLTCFLAGSLQLAFCPWHLFMCVLVSRSISWVLNPTFFSAQFHCFTHLYPKQF